MSFEVRLAAMQLRRCIEGRVEGDMTGPAVLDLVSALGGDASLIPEFVGRPALTAAYLVALVLTQSE